MIFKLYDCDIGIKYNSVSYDFAHVEEVTYENPQMNRLTRGMNSGNKIGLTYKEGTKEPSKITCPIMDMSAELKGVLDEAYNTAARLDVYVISRADGSMKMAKNAILSQKPQQLTIGVSPESMAVQLVFESFDVEETHKS